MKLHKSIGVLLFLALLLSMIPAVAFPAQAATSGTCGDNLTWSLDDEGTLTISGTGAMTDYSSSSSVPWYSSRTSITNVVIDEGVTSIGNHAFRDCSGLTSITIPDSVTSIGDYAFWGCTGLTSVTIGDSVTSIGTYAFRNCTSLTGITIGDSVTSIGSYAFSSCKGLEEINFNATAMEDLSSSNYVFAYAGQNGNGITVNIGANVTRVPAYLFYPYSTSSYAPKIATVNFAEGSVCTSIGNSAFYNCTSLTSVTIPNSVTSIGSYAFHNCTGLTSITIPDSVTSIGSSAFRGCTGLTSVTIPDGMTSLGSYAFYNCSSLSNISIPDTVTSVGASAFYGCVDLSYNTYDNGKYLGNNNNPYHGLMDTTSTDITTCTIHEDTKMIGDYAFSNCEGLTNVTIGDSVTSIGDCAFQNCTGLTSVIIPDSVTSIGDYAFRHCSGLTSITIGDSVNSIGDCAFESCSRLSDVYYNGAQSQWEAINIGGSNESLTKADLHCKLGAGVCGENLTWALDGEGKLTISGTGAMTKYSSYSAVPWYSSQLFIKTVVIDSGVTSIGDYAFSYCTGLTSITIPDNVTSIGDCAFQNCTGLTSVTIGDGVSSIGGSAFSGCTGLTSITIPDSVTSIGNSAFSGCTGLIGIYITDLGAWCNISFSGSNANPLYYAKNLYLKNELVTNLVIPDGVTSIGSYAFYNCTGLTSVTIPNSMTNIGSEAFSNCTGLAGVYITDVGAWCNISFGNFSANPLNYAKKLYLNDELVDNLVIPDGVDSIGYQAFRNCTNLISITIPNSLTSIESYAFYNCNTLLHVFYKGTISQRTQIAIETGNTNLTGAIWHYSVEPITFCNQNCYYCPDCEKSLNTKGENVKAMVTFQDEDGTVLLTDTYFYKENVIVPTAPTKEADEAYSYTFVGWSPEVTACVGDVTYTAVYTASFDLQKALEQAAANGGTVKLVKDTQVDYLTIVEGATLDLNGYTLTVDYLSAFGTVVDGTDGGNAMVKANKGIYLADTNDFLPIYDTVAGGYRFYKYQLQNLGYKAVEGNTNAVQVGIRLVLNNPAGYDVLSRTQDTKLELAVNINWTGIIGVVNYTFKESTLCNYAGKVAADLAEKGSSAKAIILTISGVDSLDEGAEISVQPTLDSVPGVKTRGENLTWTAK